MKVTFFFRTLTLTAFAALIMIGCLSNQNAQTVNNKDPKPNRKDETNSARSNSGQASSSSNSEFSKYADKKLNSMPTKSVSLKYVIEHRSALNDKVVNVSGIVVGVPQMPNDNSVSGVRNMANPQPRIFIADSAKDSRDKNRDLMVIVDETDKDYAVNQKVNLKVRISSSKVAVVLRKIS